jgi:pyruvate dehydrogenase E2 component (dihydrolipoamide acetyltransferase)
VQARSLDELMRDLADLVKRARAGSLRSSEMSDPTITVTNLGDQGVDAVYGVIYPPQVALVGFGRIAERPWAENGWIRALPQVTASLAADHRVSDGHRGALFLAELRECLQRPEELE